VAREARRANWDRDATARQHAMRPGTAGCTIAQTARSGAAYMRLFVRPGAGRGLDDAEAGHHPGEGRIWKQRKQADPREAQNALGLLSVRARDPRSAPSGSNGAGAESAEALRTLGVLTRMERRYRKTSPPPRRYRSAEESAISSPSSTMR